MATKTIRCTRTAAIVALVALAGPSATAFTPGANPRFTSIAAPSNSALTYPTTPQQERDIQGRGGVRPEAPRIEQELWRGRLVVPAMEGVLLPPQQHLTP